MLKSKQIVRAFKNKEHYADYEVYKVNSNELRLRNIDIIDFKSLEDLRNLGINKFKILGTVKRSFGDMATKNANKRMKDWGMREEPYNAISTTGA